MGRPRTRIGRLRRAAPGAGHPCHAGRHRRAAIRAGHPCHAGRLHRAWRRSDARHLGLAGTGGPSRDARPPGHARAAAGCAAPASHFILRPARRWPGEPGRNRSRAAPGEPPAASSLPPAGGTGRARPPESWVSPLWGAPVDLPEAPELAPVAGEAARRAVSASPAGPAAPPSGPGTAVPAGSRPGQRTDDAGTSVARGAAGRREPGAGRATAPDRPRELAPVRDLMPPPASRTGPAAMPGTEPGEPYREPRAPGRPYLSIGTIEVTVVPLAPPAAAGREAQPSPPVTPGWSRPPSLLASSAGRDRLRDGLRRWYGTAQG